MFKHRVNQHKIRKSKRQENKIKGTGELLTQFGYKHTYSGGYKARKEIH